MRYAAFALGILAGTLELAGAIGGLGIRGIGFAFGGGGLVPASLGVGIAMTMAIATIFCAVAIMFVRDARFLAAMIIFASIVATLAGGPFAAVGGVVGLCAAGLAYRLDRSANLV
jgi:predicted signal transduction protein with EAL and GGDEF domain